MPFLNRLLGNLAQAIANSTAPEKPIDVDHDVHYSEQKAIWFRPKSEPVQTLIEQTAQEMKGDRGNAMRLLLQWAILLPEQGLIQNEQQLYQALLEIYGRDGKLLLRNVPSLTKVYTRLEGRLTRKALEQWLESLTEGIASQKHEMSATQLRGLLHRKKSPLMINGFEDGIDFPVHVFAKVRKRVIGFLVPTVLARSIVNRDGRGVSVAIDDYPYAVDWAARFKDLTAQVKNQELDVIHLKLRDGKTKVSLVSAGAVDFARWDKFDRNTKAC